MFYSLITFASGFVCFCNMGLLHSFIYKVNSL